VTSFLTLTFREKISCIYEGKKETYEQIFRFEMSAVTIPYVSEIFRTNNSCPSSCPSVNDCLRNLKVSQGFMLQIKVNLSLCFN